MKLSTFLPIPEGVTKKFAGSVSCDFFKLLLNKLEFIEFDTEIIRIIQVLQQKTASQPTNTPKLPQFVKVKNIFKWLNGQMPFTFTWMQPV